jgi:hypothetical protein
MAVIDVADGGKQDEKAADKPANALTLKLDATKDTAERGDKTSGLGRILVQMDSNALADDVADLVLGALRDSGEPVRWPIRVVDDPALLRGADVRALLDEQIGGLHRALDSALPPAPELDLPQMDAAGLAAAVAPPMLAAFTPTAAAAALLQGAGILSTLLAHDYQLSGAEVEAGGLGFDLLVAQKLLFKHPAGVTVTVDRVLPTDVAKSAIFGRLATLDERARTELAPALVAAASKAARTKADAAALTSRYDALQAQIIELAKVVEKGADQFAAVRADQAALHDEITKTNAAAAEAQSTYDALAALAKEITAFLTAVATPAAEGRRAPLVEATRAESSTDGYLLYVRLLAAGLDEIVDIRVIRSDHWTGVSGATAEFALVRGGTVVSAGVRSALQTTTIDLAHPDDAKQRRILYADVPGFVP